MAFAILLHIADILLKFKISFFHIYTGQIWSVTSRLHTTAYKTYSLHFITTLLHNDLFIDFILFVRHFLHILYSHIICPIQYFLLLDTFPDSVRNCIRLLAQTVPSFQCPNIGSPLPISGPVLPRTYASYKFRHRPGCMFCLANDVDDGCYK